MSGSASAKNPGSWNRYAYVGGDPVNRHDRHGTCWVDGDGNTAEDSDYNEAIYSGQLNVDASQISGLCSENGDGGGNAVGGSDGVLADAGVIATVDVNICTFPAIWMGDGCDVPLDPINLAIFQQVGQNMAGFNGLLGVVAVGSAAAGAGGALAGAYIGSTFSTTFGLADAVAQPLAAIGRLADTARLATVATYSVLSGASWTYASNQVWVQSVIASGQSVLLATVLTASTTFNGGDYNEGFTMYGVELGWLLNAGYEVVGSYLVPPVK